jgi:hypothetical protein
MLSVAAKKGMPGANTVAFGDHTLVTTNIKKSVENMTTDHYALYISNL